MTSLTYSTIPSGWAVCLLNDCPLSKKCLRHAAGRLMPKDTLQHTVVLPAARKDDQCSLFAPKKPVKMAYGMSHLLEGLPTGLASTLRHQLYKIFGSTPQYYRYRDGRFPITPEQQASIARLFKENGLKQQPIYDRTAEELYFPA